MATIDYKIIWNIEKWRTFMNDIDYDFGWNEVSRGSQLGAITRKLFDTDLATRSNWVLSKSCGNTRVHSGNSR